MAPNTSHWSSHIEGSAPLMIGRVSILVASAHKLRFIKAIIALIGMFRDGIHARTPHISTLSLISVHVDLCDSKSAFSNV